MQVMCIEAAGSHNALRSVRPFGRKTGNDLARRLKRKSPREWVASLGAVKPGATTRVRTTRGPRPAKPKAKPGCLTI